MSAADQDKQASGPRAPDGAGDAGATFARRAALPRVLQGAGWPHRAVCGLLMLLFASVYLLTLHPGVDHNDRAEMQHVIPLLGIAHPPGYSIMIVVGYLFDHLPIGGSSAYRMNLLQALCATIGCVLLYSVVRRITGQILPGVVAAGVLGFSTIYWQSALVAEAYCFYAMLLLLGIYALIRFIESGRTRWLYAAALGLGACCWNRPSELFVLPAIGIAFLLALRAMRLGWGRLSVALGVSTVLFLAPLAFSLAYFKARYDPEAPYLRDDVIRDALRQRTVDYRGAGSFKNVFSYTLGLKWSGYSQKRRNENRFELDRNKLVWLLTGMNAVRSNKYAASPGSAGVSVGLPALVLALLGLGFYVRRAAWIVLGLGLFAGNTAFYFYHVPSNNLDFITPGIIGLALLAGLGTAGWGMPRKRQAALLVYQALCLIGPGFLLLVNYSAVNRNTSAERVRQEYCARLAEADLPEGAVIISERKSAMVYRYLYHVQAGRTDISVVNERIAAWPALFQRYRREGRPVFVRAVRGAGPETKGVTMPGDRIPPQYGRFLRPPQKEQLAALGFARLR